jgi:predicted transcriptional regulator
MKRTIFNVTRTFRCPNTLSAELDFIADDSDRYTSAVIREAISQYVHLYRENPDQAGRAFQ